jgi:hypothetical protein
MRAVRKQMRVAKLENLKCQVVIKGLLLASSNSVVDRQWFVDTTLRSLSPEALLLVDRRDV